MYMSIFSSTKSQGPPTLGFPKRYGITDPISEDLPNQADFIQTRKLTDCLKSYGVFEDDLELQHRYDIVVLFHYVHLVNTAWSGITEKTLMF